MIDNVTLGLRGAGVWTRVNALLVNASSTSGTLVVVNALGLAEGRRIGHAGHAGAGGQLVYHLALRERAAGRRVTRVARWQWRWLI